jgi:hypothetical protein
VHRHCGRGRSAAGSRLWYRTYGAMLPSALPGCGCRGRAGARCRRRVALRDAAFQLTVPNPMPALDPSEGTRGGIARVALPPRANDARHAPASTARRDSFACRRSASRTNHRDGMPTPGGEFRHRLPVRCFQQPPSSAVSCRLWFHGVHGECPPTGNRCPGQSSRSSSRRLVRRRRSRDAHGRSALASAAAVAALGVYRPLLPRMVTARTRAAAPVLTPETSATLQVSRVPSTRIVCSC